MPLCWAAKEAETKSTGYSIPIASYQNLHIVTTEINRLKEQNYPAYYREITQEGKKIFRVFVGPYPTKQKADAEAAKLKRTGFISSTQIISATGTAPETKGTVTNKEKQVNKETSKSKENNKTKKNSTLAKTSIPHKETSVSTSKLPQKEKKTELSPRTDQKVSASTAEKTDSKSPSSSAISKLTEAEKKPLPAAMEKPSGTISAPSDESSPDIMPSAPSLPRWPYFDDAMKDFHAGQYNKALPVFQNILTQKDIGQQWHELAERRIADCMYFLNTATDTGPLYRLVNQYNRLLLKYPDKRPENDIIYWRLGHLYKALRNYGQADNAYKKLLSLYPGSPFAEESLYQTGDILRIDKQYAAATTALKAFYVKYPNSPLSRSAIFSLADSYYNMGLSQEADIWYNSALQRWPDLYGLPEDIFLNVGYHFYSTGNYEKAFQILSYFRNLYPKSRFIPSITRAIAQCLVKMNQTASAVRFLGTALDKEKDPKEAIRIRMMLVEMGFADPKAQTSLCFSSSESYRNPIWGSDQMLIDLKNDPLAEEVLYQRGRLLETANRSLEAYNAYSELLQRYPSSRYLRNAQGSIKKIKTDLINDNYQKQDYLVVANLYLLEKDPQYPWSGDILYKIADSLKNLGLYEQATKVFNNIRNKKLYADSRVVELAIAQMDIDAGNHKAAQKRLLPLTTTNPPADAVDRKIRRLLADSYYAGGEFNKAATLYAEAMPFDKGDAFSMYRYINALKRTNQTNLALQYSQNIIDDLNAIPDKESSLIKNKIYLKQAELYSASGDPEKSIALLNRTIPSLSDDFDKHWAEFLLTGNYSGINQHDLATEASSRLRLNTDDPFWQKIADYGLNTSLWFTTNKSYLE